jgi:peptidoglycan/xylan/chitin deacetylase (PgdA/CDA1 family)
VLTFDDGFSDHYEYVLPILREFGMWGIFFPVTGPIEKQYILDVHRIHLILGQVGGARALDLLHQTIQEEMLLSEYKKKYVETYRDQDSDTETTKFKQILNYFVCDEYRRGIVDLLMHKISYEGEKDYENNFYLNESQLRDLSSEGMIIGAHSVTHPVLSKLSEESQRYEIGESCRYLKNVIGKDISTFCFPYGGNYSFSETTVELLAELGINICFNVEAREITPADMTIRPLKLPRYDCNLFPYGKATVG